VSFPKPYADAVAKVRVLCGFVMAAAFVWLSAPNAASLAAGVPVAAAGLVLRGWAAGHLEKNLALAQTGPYAFVRNPLYLGTAMAAAGFAIAARRWEVAALFAAVFVLVYWPVVELEEQHLSDLFQTFGEYARRVPRLIPRLRARSAGSKPFRWSLYRRNREYEASLGFLAALAVLIWKAR